jgi:hypothetical protein
MDYEREIRDLKAALLGTKIAVAGLALCIARTLETCDPKSRALLTSQLRDWYGQIELRGMTDAQEIALIFGQNFVDQAFPLSSDHPKDN